MQSARCWGLEFDLLARLTRGRVGDHGHDNDLASGAQREPEAPWAELFSDCGSLAQVASTVDGLAGIHPMALWGFDYVRFSRAP